MSDSLSPMFNPGRKAVYTILEAAIRWSGLLDSELEIKKAMEDGDATLAQVFPYWPDLNICAELISVAVYAKELPHYIDRSNIIDGDYESDVDVRIRHDDLKAWVAATHSHMQPPFLFGDKNQKESSQGRLEAYNALQFENDRLKVDLESVYAELKLVKCRLSLDDNTGDISLDARSKMSYRNIIGALLILMLGDKEKQIKKDVYNNKTDIKGAILAHFDGLYGAQPRTLDNKLLIEKLEEGEENIKKYFAEKRKKPQ